MVKEALGVMTRALLVLQPFLITSGKDCTLMSFGIATTNNLVTVFHPFLSCTSHFLFCQYAGTRILDAEVVCFEAT